MNVALKNIIATQEPKIQTLSDKDKGFYLFGLHLLAGMVSEKFLDIPQLGENKYEKDGLFYSIPYFQDEKLWLNGKDLTLLVVYKIESKSSYCPLRIDVRLIDEQNYALYVYEQGEKTVKSTLLAKENGQFHTTIPSHSIITLSQLVKDEKEQYVK